MWLAGALGLAGVVALVSGGGGGGGGGHSHGPSAAGVKTLDAPVLKFDPQSGKLTVEGRPGAMVEVKGQNGQPAATQIIGSDGRAEIQIPAAASNQNITATQKLDGVVSAPSPALALPLSKPSAGSIDLDKGELLVTGKPGSTAQLLGKDGKPIGDAVPLDDKGQGVIKLPQGVGGESVGIVAKDNGKESPAATVEVPLLKPVPGVVDAEKGELPVTGKPGSTAQLLGKDGKPIGDAVPLDDKGQGVIKLPQGVGGESVGIVAKDNGKESPAATVEVPLLKPVPGVVDAEKGELPVTGKPGSTAQLLGKDGKPIGDAVPLDDKGQGVIKLPQGVGGESVGIVAKDNGKESPAATVEVPLLKPVPGVVDAEKGELPVTGKPGSTAQLLGKDGKPIGDAVPLDDKGQGVIKLPQGVGGESVGIVAKDNGKESPAATVEVPLLKPVPGVVDAEKGELPVTGKPGSTAQLLGKDGKPIGDAVPLDDKGQGVIKLPQGVGGESVGIVAKDNGKESPAATVEVPLLKPVPGVVDAEKGELPVTGKPGSTAQLLGKDGKPIGDAVPLDDKGQGVIKLPQGVGGESVGIVAKDNGKESPAATVDLPLLAPVFGFVDAKNNILMVSGKAGATVQLKDLQGKAIGVPVLLDEQGEAVIELDPGLSDKNITMTQSAKGLESVATPLTIPLLTPVLSEVDPQTREVVVSGKPNASFRIFNEETGKLYKSGTFDSSGVSTVKLRGDASGQKIVATQSVSAMTNARFKRSLFEEEPSARADKLPDTRVSEFSSAVEVPLFSPDLALNDAGDTLNVWGMPEATVEVSGSQDVIVGRILLDSDGWGVLPLSQAMGGEKLNALVRDKERKSATESIDVPLLKPVLGAVDLDKSELPVTGKPGTIVQLQKKDGKPLGDAVPLDDQGQGVIKLPQAVSGEAVGVVASTAGQQSPAATVAVPPLKPTLGAIGPQTGKVEVIGKPGATVQLKDSAGKPVGEPVTLDGEGKGAIQIPTTASGQAVSAVQKVGDVESLPSAAVTVPLLKPVLGTVDADKGELPVTGKPGSTAQLLDKDGKPIGDAVPLGDKGQGVIKLPQGVSGESVGVVVKADGQQSPAATVAVPPLKPTLGAVDPQTGKVEVVGKPGATAQLKDSAGKSIGEPVPLDSQGKGEIEVPSTASGQMVAAVQKVNGVESPASAAVEVPLLKPALGVVDAEKGELLVTGKPGSTAQLLGKDGKPIGDAVPLDDKGQGVIKLPQGVGGESVGIVAKDNGKESPAATVEVPLLKPVLGVVDAEKGELPVTGKPGSTAQLLGKDGKPIGDAVPLDDKGQGVIKLPQGVGGESVGIVAKDNGKESPAATVEVPLLKPVPGVVDAEKGELPVTGKPGSTAQLLGK
ncbi:hypothetical protein, partial [Pseudomonas sp. VB3]|uniref:hypothetical protein n=1 Tax=Pseudomonas sp. VB3 TaxID=2994641 RepID=UPI0022EC5C9D